MKIELRIHNGLKEMNKEEWVSFWRRYNIFQFWNKKSENINKTSSTQSINRDEIKKLYPDMENIVDILIDNNIPFSYDGVFELTDEDNAVIASAAMIIDNPKIAIDPTDDNDRIIFEQKGYRVIKQEEFNVELIK